jgi:gluconolactonase
MQSFSQMYANRHFRSLCLISAALLWMSSNSAWSQVTAPGAELKLVADGFQFTEGPTADENGNVYFTDQPNDRIVQYDFATGKANTWMQPCGRSNGLYFVSPGRLIACADEKNELWSIDIADKQHQVLAKDFAGRGFGGPNDCWVDDHDGAIYFTDPLYKRPYWTQTIPDDHPRGVYRRSADGMLTQVADDFVQPNGIIGNAQKRLLYVADIGARKTYRYKIADDGPLTDKTLFCESGSDGMTLDSQGNLYLTGNKGVTVYNQQGELVQTIGVPRGWTANVTFAGPEKRHLFITAGDAVFVIEMATAGQ